MESVNDAEIKAGNSCKILDKDERCAHIFLTLRESSLLMLSLTLSIHNDHENEIMNRLGL